MKKLILFFVFCFVAVNVFAGGIRFVESKKWKEILAMAKKEQKLIFLDGYASWCGPCRYMQQNVFTAGAVSSYYNAHFINVKMDMEEGEGVRLAEQLGITAYPTLFFVNGNGEVVHKYVGALNATEFLDLGKAALNPERQYYTLKKKAAAGSLNPKAFHSWIHTAEQMQDEDADSIITRYLSVTRHPMLEKEMLLIMLDHGSALTSQQLAFLNVNRQQIMTLTGLEKEGFENRLLSRVRFAAINSSVSGDEIDFDVFRKTIAVYFPDKALLEQRKLKVKYYFHKDESEQALQELMICLKDTSLRLSALEMASLIAGYSEEIAASNRMNHFLEAIEQFRLMPQDRGAAYYKDYAHLAIYYRKGDKEKFAAVAARMLANSNLPDEVRAMVLRLSDQ